MPTYLPLAIVSSVLLGMPHPGAAQSTEPVSLPKYYVGLAAYTSAYQPVGSRYWYRQKGFSVPLQVTVGYQFRPRWAVQAGLTFRGYSQNNSYVSYDYLGNGKMSPPFAVEGTDWVRTFSASVLARHTLTRAAVHRMQFDLLAGLTLEHFRNSWRTTRTDSARAPVTTTDSYHSSRLLVTGGLGMRYRCSQRLEATYNLLLNYGVNGGYGYSDRFTNSMALGAQYRFGR